MATYQFSFEKLEVWQLARVLVKNIYVDTQNFPADERFGLVSQIRRSAVSITANIAEGSARTSPKDQAKFTTQAYASLLELFNHLVIAADLGYIKEDRLKHYRQQVQPLSVKLSNLKASQLNRLNKLSAFLLPLGYMQIFQQLPSIS
jgi:four helix bundle protein